MKKPLLNTDTFLRVLADTMGNQALAAEKLGLTRQAVNLRIHKNKKIEKAYQQILERNIDFAESKLMMNIKEGKEASVFFYLKCQAKHRGYIERSEVGVEHMGPVEFKYVDAE
jgi:hypothetical protein